MIGAILFVVLSCAYVIWALKVNKTGGHRLPPLYPGELPIIGHLHLLVGNGISLWRTLKDFAVEAKNQGGVICLHLGTKLHYLITDPEDALTASNACLQKHFVYDYVKPWLGDGLVTASGETWKRHRKLLTPAFSLPVTYTFLDVFNCQSRKFVQNIQHEVGNYFDHTVYLKNIALETFCLTAFGMSSLEDKDFIVKYMHATSDILSIVTSRFQNFWMQSDVIFKLSGLKKKQDRLVKIVNDMSNTVIQKKKTAINNNDYTYSSKISGIRYKPLLDLLLELSEDNALTDKEIREEVDTAIIAGFDTTSSVLGMVLIFLGAHPEVQEKVYQEIKVVFETDRDVDKDDLKKLVYVEAVIKESIRISPSGPMTLRYVDKDVKLKNYTMRAGSQCVVMLSGCLLDPVWGKDVEVFRPERWLEPEMTANPPAFAGFSLGKRSCMGKAYAMTTMKTFLAHFLRHYKVIADDSNLKLRFDFLVKPVSGHEICLQKRV